MQGKKKRIFFSHPVSVLLWPDIFHRLLQDASPVQRDSGGGMSVHVGFMGTTAKPFDILKAIHQRCREADAHGGRLVLWFFRFFVRKLETNPNRMGIQEAPGWFGISWSQQNKQTCAIRPWCPEWTQWGMTLCPQQLRSHQKQPRISRLSPVTPWGPRVMCWGGLLLLPDVDPVHLRSLHMRLSLSQKFMPTKHNTMVDSCWSKAIYGNIIFCAGALQSLRWNNMK